MQRRQSGVAVTTQLTLHSQRKPNHETPSPRYRRRAALTPEDRTPTAGARSAAELIAAFPQPSFQEYVPLLEGTDAAQYAGRINNRAY